MKILFVVDPIDSFKIEKDTTYAMMRQASRLGIETHVVELHDLYWESGSHVCARATHIELASEVPQTHQTWYESRATNVLALKDFDAVLMRKDPPFDMEYFYATHLLSRAKTEGAKVFNNPEALREHPEKLAILNFPHWISPTLVTREAEQIKAFHALHKDIILKPLDGMGGMGIYRVKEDALNLGSLIEGLNQEGQQSVMAQKFIPAIKEGDKRILLINGEAVPFCLARIPQGTEVRGNLAAGGKGVARPLSDRDWAIAKDLGPTLAAKGLFLVGLDVIGEHLTEINVTSPTCFQEITNQTGCDVASLFMDALIKALSK
jgi:glutathione synthase